MSDYYIDKLIKQKDDAYWERNQIVSALSKTFPSHLRKHGEDPDWDKEWTNIVCVHLNTGEQVSWHIHDRDVPYFSHLSFGEDDYDGHDNVEKYRRLAELEVSGV